MEGGSLSLGEDPTPTVQNPAEVDPNNGPSSCSCDLEFIPVASPRSSHRNGHGLSVLSPRSGKSLRPEVAAPTDKFRRRFAKKEIIRRALMPPVKRPTLRWLDFRPTPSRLCNMSIG